MRGESSCGGLDGSNWKKIKRQADELSCRKFLFCFVPVSCVCN